MGKVLFGLSMSLDGFIADKNDDVSEILAWMGSAMEHFYEVAGDPLKETGAVIMGRRSFNQIDGENGWVFPDGTAPDWPVIVLQSQARAPLEKGQDTILLRHRWHPKRDCASTGARRREKCGPAWGQLRPTSLAGGSARRIPYEHCPCSAG
jgi:hypothetical protein